MQSREQARFQVWFPVQLVSGTQAKIAMAHNSSAGGMLVAVSSSIGIGETVEVSFRLPSSELEHRMTGRVLRIEPNALDPEGAWPERIAIAFDELSPQLAPYLEAAATRLSQP